MAGQKIKVKAMGLFVADGRMLVMDCFDSVKREPYFRLLGGQVEFGERADETLRREMQEELGTAVEVEALLDVVQSVFTYNGRPHHEVVFIHQARFVDASFNAREDLRNIEPGKDEPFLWKLIPELLNGPIPLHPATDYKRLLSVIGDDSSRAG